jgi:hypothetical protein
MDIKKPMMQCGHRANATQTQPDGSKLNVCVICIGDPGADRVMEEEPDLTGRIARCAYIRSCKSEKPSTDKLAFFEHKPGAEFDTYYCGCMGWD